MEAANLDVILARFTEHWSPKKIAQVNDYDVRIVKIQGEFTWHRHADTDEFFLVLDGRLTIQMRDRDVVLGPRELFVVSSRPRASAEVEDCCSFSTTSPKPFLLSTRTPTLSGSVAALSSSPFLASRVGSGN